MGSSSSSPAGQEIGLQKYYAATMRRMKIPVEGTVGGCDCIRGAADLQGYENSVYSKAKERLIRSIAIETFALLRGKSSLDFKTADIDKVLDQLTKICPNPKRKGTAIDANKDIHEDVVVALTNAINKSYGSEIIDDEAALGVKAAKCAEIIHSLARDVNSEFMTVAGDIERSVRNLHTLREYLGRTHERIMEVVGTSGDATVQMQAAAVDEFYKALLVEVDRQLVILGNMVSGVIGPTKDNLISLLEDNDDFKGFVDKIKASVGSTEFGSRLGYLLAGVDVLAQIASRVNKALKAVGMSVKEYKDSANMADLREKLYKHMGKGKSVTSKELAEFVAATEILQNADYAHDQIAEYLSKKGGEVYGAMEVTGAAEGGAVDDIFGSKFTVERSLGKRMEKQEKFRDRLFADFYDNLLTAYRKVVAAVDELGPKIGRSLPISDELDRFIRSFSEMEIADRENFHVVLSGWQRDVVSRDYKNRFMMTLDTVHKQLQTLRSVSKSSDLAAIESAISDLKKLVTEFNDKFLGAITEVALPRVNAVSGKAELESKDEDDYGSAGGAGESALSGLASKLKSNVSHAIDNMAEIAESKASELVEQLQHGAAEISGGRDSSQYYTSIKTAQRKLLHYYRIATISGDLARASEDMKEYGTGYETLLGEAMGRFVDDIERDYDLELKGLDFEKEPKKDSVGETFKKFVDFQNGDSGTANTAADQKPRRDQVIMWIDMLKKYYVDKRDSKKNLVKVAQAIDLYLKAFARAQAAHPDEVRDLSTILDQVQATAKFFSERSGNNIAALFEEFPSDIVVDQDLMSSVVPGKAASPYNPADKNHYYEFVSKRVGDNGLLGNPFFGRLLWNKQEYIELMKKSTKAVGGVRALENLVSVFINAGSKFTGQTLEKETFMDHRQIIKALMDYWTISLITMGAKGAATQVDAGVESLAVTDYHFGVDDQIKADALAGNFANRKTVGASISWHPNAYALQNGEAKSAIAGSISTAASEQSALLNVRMKIAFSMGTCLGEEKSAFRQQFSKTDELFTMIIQSMASKILILTETFALFHRPAARQVLSMSPFRMILGGAKGGALDDVEVIDDAAELYVRLPLLGEWYREILMLPSMRVNGSVEDAENFIVSIVPDSTSIWSEFMMLVFDRTDFVKEGTYSEGDIRALIKSINKVYAAYRDKDPKISTRNVINSLVTEVNRRYGFVKRDELDRYYQKRRDVFKTDPGSFDENDRVDFDILDSKNAFGSRPAPSDQFASFRSFDPQVQQIWTAEVRGVVDKFRGRLLSDMESITKMESSGNDQVKHSFDESIRNTTASLHAAKGSSDKLQIVMRAMQGISKFGGFRMEHALMFQELVILPMTSLFGVWKVLNEFNILVQSTQYNIANTDKALTGDRNARFDAFVAEKRKFVPANAKHYLLDDSQLKTEFEKYAIAATVVDPKIPANMQAGYRLAALFGDLTRSIYSVGTDLGKLCEVNITTDGGILIDFTQLREHVARVLGSVKHSFGMFRSIYGSEFVQAFEQASTIKSYSDVRATYYDMEEQLLEILLRDRDKNGLPRVSEILSSTFKFIKTHSPPGDLADQMDALVYWSNSGTLGSVPTSRTDNVGSFPFNLIPQYDNGAGGQARSEEEKAIMRNLSNVVDDVKLAVETAQNSQWIIDLKDMVTKWRAVLSAMSLMAASPDLKFSDLIATNYTAGPAGLGKLDTLYVSDQMAAASIQAANVAIVKFQNDALGKIPVNNARAIGSLLAGVQHAAGLLRAHVAAAKLLTVTLGPILAVAPGTSVIPDAKDTASLNAAFDTLLDGLPASIRNYASFVPASLADLETRAAEVADQGPFVASAVGPASDWSDHTDFTDLTTGTGPLNGVIEALNRLVSENARQNDIAQKAKIGLLGKFAASANVVDKVASHFVVGESGAMPSGDGGLLVKFNQLLAQYLSLFYDGSSRKFYLPLITGFARSQSAAIMNGKALRDIDGGPSNDLNPADGVVLFSGNARAIRNIMSATNPQTGIKLYATDKLAEVADYMLENLRGNLPWFIRYFNEIRQQAEYLKRMVIDSGLKFTESKNGIASPSWNMKQDNLSVPFETRGSGTAKNNFYVSILDNIISAVNAVSGGAAGVYKELVDVPLYFELYQNSISEYRNRNGRLPLMPMSYILYPLGKDASTYGGLLAPGNKAGSDQFKFNYGLRRLLTDTRDAFKLSYAPGLESAIEAFNGMSAINLKFEKGYVEQQMRDVLNLQQWLLSGRSSKLWLGGTFLTSSKAALAPAWAIPKSTELQKAVANKSFPLAAASVVNLTATIESGDARRVSEEVLASSVPSAQQVGTGSDARSMWRKYNILDMNIVPINIHALARDVPLIHLINYSYSLGEITEEFLRRKWRNREGYGNRGGHKAHPSIYPEDVVAKLLSNPYAAVDGKEYYGLLHRAVLGDMGIQASRPKFLSDQLWNKSLLNEQYLVGARRDNDTAYGVDGKDRGLVEDDAKGFVVNPHGPSDDSAGQRGIGAYKLPENATDAAKNGRREETKLSAPSFNSATSREVAVMHSVSGHKPALLRLGRVRFTTTFMRNMMLVTWAQYVTRLMIRERLEKLQTPVVDGMELMDARFTEYQGDERFNADAY